MVSIDGALVALAKAAMIAGATAGGGPAAGAAVATFVKTPAGDALARGIVSTVGGSQAEPFAMGGLVSQPTFALVGEAGPELILPITPEIKKKSRKKTKTDKNMSKALRMANARFRKKNGSLRKGATQGKIMKYAHKLLKKM